MKSLKSILEASILADIDDQLEAADASLREMVVEFINHNYYISGKLTISDEPNKDGKYEVSCNGDVRVRILVIDALTNGLFEWTKINGSFACVRCHNIKSLEGGPKEVKECYYCSRCELLETLKGAPKKVGDDFCCDMNDNLRSLEYAPKTVGGSFNCSECPLLTSLEGGPTRVGKDYACHHCISLKSLKGAPKEIKRSFYCFSCGALSSLKDGPQKVAETYDASNCSSLDSIYGIAKYVGRNFKITNTMFKSYTEEEIRSKCKVDYGVVDIRDW